HRGETRISKSCDCKQEGNQVKVGREDCGNQHGHADSSKNNQGLARRTERPSPLDQIPGYITSEKAAQIGGDEWDPYGNQSVLEVDAFCDQVNRKPFRDEEENRVGASFRSDHAPRLRKSQQFTPSEPRFALPGVIRFLFVRDQHFKFSWADSALRLRRIIEPPPNDQPEKSKNSREHECRAPAPAKINP